MNEDRKREVCVVGGGAAGMMAAIAAAKGGASVTLFEKNEKLGKKIYITGKGRCNYTNACPPSELLSHIVGKPRFLHSAFSRFNNLETVAFFEKLGLASKVERGERVFPLSDKASDVIRALEEECRRLGVTILLHSRIRGITSKQGRVDALVTEAGEEFRADAVILATGGLSYPSTGSTGDGYAFAEQLGHRIIPTRPSLVPLLTAEDFVPRLQGLSLRNIRLTVKEEGSKKALYEGFGELLFTDKGISGPLSLTASTRIGDALERGRLRALIDLKPALSDGQLDARLQRELQAAPKKEIKNILPSLYPSLLRPVIAELAGLDPEKRCAEISRKERERLVEVTKSLPLSVTGTGGYREAVITQGGVDTREIDPATMESKLCKGLYFAGEVLNLDAETGGFNLQIAWSTGRAAGEAAADKGEERMSKQIAIDGPSGAGKSTIAKELARRLGYIYVDTGAMYRAMAVHFLGEGIDVDNEEAVSECAKSAQLDWEIVDGSQHIFLNGRDVNGEIRTEEIGMIASSTSAFARVREILVAAQQRIAASRDVVMDGRDIGTVVLPDADVKVFLTASVEVRAMRRYQEILEKGGEADLEKVEEDIRKRDYQDTHREVSPLTQADDAVLIDTSEMSIEEVVAAIEALL